MTKIQQLKNKLTLTFLLTHTLLYSQTISKDSLEDITSKKNQFSIDYFVFPAIIYNSLTFGVNYFRTTKYEHSLKFGAAIFLIGGGSKKFNINYNLNIYTKNRKNYLPIWLGLRNSLNDVGYEEGYYPNTLQPSIGFGFGRVSRIFKKLTTRLEFIAGASLNLTNGSYDVYPFGKLNEYSFDKYYPQYHPKVVPALRFKMTFVKKI